MILLTPASLNAAIWDGFYSKISLGYGKPILNLDGITFDDPDSNLSIFLYNTSGSFRWVGFNELINDNFGVGCEIGGIYGPFEDKVTSQELVFKWEIVPQVSYIYEDNTRLFIGVGLGYGNGYGYKGLPSAFQESLIDKSDDDYSYSRYGSSRYGSYYWKDNYNEDQYYFAKDPKLYADYYIIAETGVDFLFENGFFIGAKYQYERTLNNFQDDIITNVLKISAYVEQHNIMFSIGIKY